MAYAPTPTIVIAVVICLLMAGGSSLQSAQTSVCRTTRRIRNFLNGGSIHLPGLIPETTGFQ